MCKGKLMFTRTQIFTPFPHFAVVVGTPGHPAHVTATGVATPDHPAPTIAEVTAHVPAVHMAAEDAHPGAQAQSTPGDGMTTHSPSLYY